MCNGKVTQKGSTLLKSLHFVFFLFGQFHILVLLQMKQCLCADCCVIEICILFYVVGLFHV